MRQTSDFYSPLVHPIFRVFAKRRVFTSRKLTDFAIQLKREVVDPRLNLFCRVVRNSLISGHAWWLSATKFA
jgi:hypothetical protein